MTEDEVTDFICKSDGATVLSRFTTMPTVERRKHAKAIGKLFSATEWSQLGYGGDIRVKDSNATTIAVLATATLSELKKLNLRNLPSSPNIVEVLSVIKPDWIEGWVTDLIDGDPYIVARLQSIWQAGLCPRPTSDAYILGYFASGYPGMTYDDTFFEHDVWRFFEVEGGDGFNLTSNDSGREPTTPDSWWFKLRAYAEEGKLDRNRLLDASLDAIGRGFTPHATSWFLKFHSSLEPTLDELAERQGRYVGLLGATGPQTVVFAIKALDVLRKAKAIDAALVVPALQPALQARTKAGITAALRLLANLAKDHHSHREEAALVATHALISEDVSLQTKTLDLIEKLDCADDPHVRAAIADYVPFAAASVQGRMAALSGAEVDGQGNANEDAPTWSTPIPSPIQPVANADEALALFLKVLESPRDPIEVERAVDGISRFGAILRNDDERLSPLKKRAAQFYGKSDEHELRLCLAITGRALAERTSCKAIMKHLNREQRFHALDTSEGRKTMCRLFLDRNAESLEQIATGAMLPLLSLPSDTTGCIDCADLLSRLATYRAAGIVPGSIDLQLALLRLAKDGRPDAASMMTGDKEFDRAVLYALGVDITPGKNAALWAAAWAAKQPTAADNRIAKLFSHRLPDCGVPADTPLTVWPELSKDGADTWTRITLPAGTTKRSNANAAIPAMFFAVSKYDYLGTTVFGAVYEDVAWASLVRPGHPEPFFRQAILAMASEQKLSDHYCLAYLEPFFRPGITLGPLARATLAYYLVSVDKPLASLTIEAVTELAITSRLTAFDFADAIRPFFLVGTLPTARWTRALTKMAKSGADIFARDVVTHLLTFTPDQTPRDIGGMLEFLYEIHIATKTAPENADTLACLQAILGGGKVATFKRKLLQMAKISRSC